MIPHNIYKFALFVFGVFAIWTAFTSERKLVEQYREVVHVIGWWILVMLVIVLLAGCAPQPAPRQVPQWAETICTKWLCNQNEIAGCQNNPRLEKYAFYRMGVANLNIFAHKFRESKIDPNDVLNYDPNYSDFDPNNPDEPNSYWDN